MSGSVLVLALGAAAGFAAGLVYFAALWRAARRVTAGGGIATLAGGALFRVAVLSALVAGALAAGATPTAVLAAAAGFLAARLLATRRLSAAVARRDRPEER